VISRFFIDRPIFAVSSPSSSCWPRRGRLHPAGGPVPEVTPPTVQVTALYPGANALTVRDTVAAPIEEQVSGVEGMLSMSSQSPTTAPTPTVTFRLAWIPTWPVLVQNRVSLALPSSPPGPERGISVKKMTPTR